MKIIVLLAALAALPAAAETLPPVELYVPKVCLACLEWAEHLRQNGFSVTVKEAEDIAAVKRRFKVPADAASRMTARVADYFVEGHVPAGDIKDLLKEKPRARGLAVPGLPMGAPGFEPTGADANCERGCTILDPNSGERIPRREFFNTLLVLPDGKTKVWARH
ncbi:MAG: metal-binding protein [Zoogloeaceae bacterium]|nr:metal-binding protein [Zoogloeaceae bacterium]MCK6382813.1 metal-binding protein [Rhodocyclaceae bacterium]